MPYRFRNREKLNAPQRYEDDQDGEHSHRPISYEVPNSDEEVYASGINFSKAHRYRGRVTQYNPNLPPAVFPTLELGRKVPTPEHHDESPFSDAEYFTPVSSMSTSVVSTTRRSSDPEH